MSSFATPGQEVYLLFGKNGWIGGKLIELLTEQKKTFYLAESRSQNRESVIAEIEKYKPTHVLNAAGVTGRPNVDWCEDNKAETIRTNVIGTLNLADICAEKGIHHLLYATGCIFEYDDIHKIGGVGFTEEDSANFHGSFYSHTKVITLLSSHLLFLISNYSTFVFIGYGRRFVEKLSYHLCPSCPHAYL